MPTFSQEAALSLKTYLGSSSEPREFRGETTLEIDCFQIQKAARHLKESLGYSFLVDITSIDNLPAKPRFEIAYEFYHFEKRASLRLKISVAEDQKVPSITSIYATANWHEREIYDMMGISFEGHPDLRRILMWEGYPYFPLRKDFPLEGKPTDMPDEAFTETAPLEGGPFVTAPASLSMDREPRARPAQN